MSDENEELEVITGEWYLQDCVNTVQKICEFISVWGTGYSFDTTWTSIKVSFQEKKTRDRQRMKDFGLM